MNVAALETIIWTKLNDGGGVYYPNVTGALNEAQRLFVLLSLCLESNATLALTAGQLSYNILPTAPRDTTNTQFDFILPQRVYNSSGQQLRPATIAELEALDSGWQNTPGVPSRYVFRGLDWMAIYPQPPQADTLTLVQARCPATLTGGASVPEIRQASHYALANHAAWALRQPEGGQEFAKFASYLQEFLDEAGKVAALVRERNRDAGFETTMPFELERVK